MLPSCTASLLSILLLAAAAAAAWVASGASRSCNASVGWQALVSSRLSTIARQRAVSVRQPINVTSVQSTYKLLSNQRTSCCVKEGEGKGCRNRPRDKYRPPPWGLGVSLLTTLCPTTWKQQLFPITITTSTIITLPATRRELRRACCNRLAQLQQQQQLARHRRRARCGNAAAGMLPTAQPPPPTAAAGRLPDEQPAAAREEASHAAANVLSACTQQARRLADTQRTAG